MPYLFPVDPGLQGSRNRVPKRRRPAPGSPSLGQVLSDSQYDYLNLQIVDKSGSKVAFKKFYIDATPSEYPSGATSSIQKGMFEIHESETTDANGMISISMRSDVTKAVKVSVTPLFQSPFANKDQAIIWQVPMTIGKQGENVYKVVLEPGGGLNKAPALPGPTPAPSLPAQTTSTSPSPDGTSSAGGDFPWDIVIVGGIALLVGIYVFPKMFGDA